MSDFEDAEGTQLSDLTEESKDQKTLAEERALIDRFDASQYAFFGKDVTQEVELGVLEDEDDTGQLGHLTMMNMGCLPFVTGMRLNSHQLYLKLIICQSYPALL